MNSTGLPAHWVSALFKKFQVRYGHKFTTSIDGLESLAIDEWAKGLSGVTGEQIKHGLEVWAGEWPPSLAEFRDVCTGKSKELNEFGLNYVPEVYRIPERRPEKLLSGPEREARLERGKVHLALLKQKMGIK